MAKNTFDLIILKGPQEGKKIRFEEEEITIGRKYENTLVINSLTVSGKNCKIFQEGDNFYIEDFNSLNGTFVNNKKVERTRIYSGDKLEIGSALLLFMIKGQDLGMRPPEEEAEQEDVGKATIVMGEKLADAMVKGDISKGVPQIQRNPLVIILLLLIIVVISAIGYFYFRNAPDTSTTVAKVKTTKQIKTTKAKEEKIDLKIPVIDRGDMTTSQIFAIAEDFYNKGKENYDGKQLKNSNLYQAIQNLKMCLAYLALTEQKPPFADKVRPLAEKAYLELDKECKELNFLARKLSRQENYEEAKKYFNLIKLKVPYKNDKRYKDADHVIKYFVARNLVKSYE